MAVRAVQLDPHNSVQKTASLSDWHMQSQEDQLQDEQAAATHPTPATVAVSVLEAHQQKLSGRRTTAGAAAGVPYTCV